MTGPVKTAANIVEILANGIYDEGQAFDQPCLYGNRVGAHSVYCHHPDDNIRHRKCFYRWCSRSEHAENKCGGYIPNTAWTDKMDAPRAADAAERAGREAEIAKIDKLNQRKLWAAMWQSVDPLPLNFLRKKGGKKGTKP
jgi:hypothetical protein